MGLDNGFVGSIRLIIVEEKDEEDMEMAIRFVGLKSRLTKNE